MKQILHFFSFPNFRLGIRVSLKILPENCCLRFAVFVVSDMISRQFIKKTKLTRSLGEDEPLQMVDLECGELEYSDDEDDFEEESDDELVQDSLIPPRSENIDDNLREFILGEFVTRLTHFSRTTSKTSSSHQL